MQDERETLQRPDTKSNCAGVLKGTVARQRQRHTRFFQEQSVWSAGASVDWMGNHSRWDVLETFGNGRMEGKIRGESGSHGFPGNELFSLPDSRITKR